ncbi:MAG: DUF1822 family protein [Leptolyngbyaceae cyanobacterium bins.349]|nr:DUF1822 family protein [Leptolyngbyaceae cyanobacterium bins.349]
MTNLSSFSINSRLLPPEFIWLESEHIEQAKAMSNSATSEAQQWQSYLKALALLGFEQWLKDRLPEHSITRPASPLSQGLSQPFESVGYVEVSGFTICLIAVEHVLDEMVRIPQAVVEQPALAAHFYVVQEVSEEQELVTIRGFCRYDELINHQVRHHYPVQDGYYQLPLAFLDAEPNHLLVYCRCLQPSAIALRVTESSGLPTSHSAIATDQSLPALTHTTARLSQWLQNTFDESWQAIDRFIYPDAALSFGTRSIESGVRRGKLINLGVQLGSQTVVLLVTVTSEAEGKLGVLVQLHPTGAAQYLSANLKLSLRSQTGKTLQEVTARSQDNYIQLKPFKGNSGTRFSVAIYLGSETVEEKFEL